MLVLLVYGCSKDATDPPPPEVKVDTTSHNFVWQIDTLGDLTSILSSVFAINEDDIWIGGEIDRNDTTYNALHWNGIEWEWFRVPYASSVGVQLVVDIKAFFAFNPNEIWTFSRIGSYGYWKNGIKETDIVTEIRGSVWQIYGTSSGDLHFVGTNGNITHFNGATWELQNNASTTDLWDITGSNFSAYRWACGYEPNNTESILLIYDGSSWNTHWNWSLQTGASDSNYVGLLQSLWAMDSDSILIVGGEGAWRQDIEGLSPPRREDLNLNRFPRSVRGSAPNNIFIVGDEGMIWHFNGKNWKEMREVRNPNWIFNSVSVLENKVTIVGLDFSQGNQRSLIVTGIRQ